MNPYEKRVADLAATEGYKFAGPYVNSQTKSVFIHTEGKCGGHEFSMTPNKFLQGRRCPRCAGVERYTTESYKAYIEEKTKNKWTLIGDYIGNDVATTFGCVQCRMTYSIRPRIFISRKNEMRCQCGNEFPTRQIFLDIQRSLSKEKKTTSQVQDEIDEVFGKGEYILQEDYINSMAPINVLHTQCGMITKKRIDAMIHHAEGCLSCSGLAPISYEEAFAAVASSGSHEMISTKNEYENTKSMLLLRHRKSGIEYSVTYKDFIHKGHRGHHTSGPEEEIINFLEKDLNVQIKQRDRTILAPLEIDIFAVKDKIGIEYNGSYFHSDRFKPKDYHLRKTELADSQNIRLIQISDSEWKFKTEIVQSKLMHLFGKTLHKVSARSLSVYVIDNDLAVEFFEKTHIQGAPRGAFITYALIDKEMNVWACAAVSLYGTALGRRETVGSAEIVRYSSALFSSVRGGFSKLTKAIFEDNKDITSLQTFADRMWSDGKLYAVSGWKTDGTVQPRYRYVHAPSARSYHRTSFTKDKIAKKFPQIYDANLTEREMMDKTNYVRVYDAGKIRFSIQRREVVRSTQIEHALIDA